MTSTTERVITHLHHDDGAPARVGERRHPRQQLPPPGVHEVEKAAVRAAQAHRAAARDLRARPPGISQGHASLNRVDGMDTITLNLTLPCPTQQSASHMIGFEKADTQVMMS